MIYPTTQAALDLDQKAIESQLALKTPQSFTAANQIYSQGAFSKPYAKLTLSSPLTTAIAAGVDVTGVASDGTTVTGATYKAASVGDDMLEVQYKVIGIQDTYVNCQVGANPNPNTAGCKLSLPLYMCFEWYCPHSSTIDLRQHRFQYYRNGDATCCW